MAAETFDRCLAHVLLYEGGFVDHPKDPGGATNLGITRDTLARHRGRPVSVAEVKALTRAEAAAIYRKSYWAQVRGDDLPAGLDLVIFDYGVNSGPSRAVKALQQSVGVDADGQMGPKTLAALRRFSPAVLIYSICSARLAFLRGLDTWSTFGKGWQRRVEAVEAEAQAMLAASERAAKPAAAAKPAVAPVPSRASTAAPPPARLEERPIAKSGFWARIGALLSR